MKFFFSFLLILCIQLPCVAAVTEGGGAGADAAPVDEVMRRAREKHLTTWNNMVLNDEIGPRDWIARHQIENVRKRLGLPEYEELEIAEHKKKCARNITEALNNIIQEIESGKQDIATHTFACLQAVHSMLMQHVYELEDYSRAPWARGPYAEQGIQERCRELRSIYLAKNMALFSRIYKLCPQLERLPRSLSNVLSSHSTPQLPQDNNPYIPILQRVVIIMRNLAKVEQVSSIEGRKEEFLFLLRGLSDEFERMSVAFNEAVNVAQIGVIFRRLSYCPTWEVMGAREQDIKLRGLNPFHYFPVKFVYRLFGMLAMGVETRIPKSLWSFSSEQIEQARLVLNNPQASVERKRAAQQVVLYAQIPFHKIHALSTIVFRDLRNEESDLRLQLAEQLCKASYEMSTIASHISTILDDHGRIDLPAHVYTTDLEFPVIDALYQKYAGYPQLNHLVASTSRLLTGFRDAEKPLKEKRFALMHALQSVGEFFKTLPDSARDRFVQILSAGAEKTVDTLLADLRDLLSHLERATVQKRLFLLVDANTTVFDEIAADLKVIADTARVIIGPLAGHYASNAPIQHTCVGLVHLHEVLTSCAAQEIEEIVKSIPSQNEIDASEKYVRELLVDSRDEAMTLDEWKVQREILEGHIGIFGLSNNLSARLLRAFQCLKPEGYREIAQSKLEDLCTALKNLHKKCSKEVQEHLAALLQTVQEGEPVYEVCLQAAGLQGKKLNGARKKIRAILELQNALQATDRFSEFITKEKEQAKKKVTKSLAGIENHVARVEGCKLLFSQQIQGVQSLSSFLRKCRSFGIVGDEELEVCCGVYMAVHPSIDAAPQVSKQRNPLKMLRYNARKVLGYLTQLDHITSPYRTAGFESLWKVLRSDAILEYACKFFLSAYRKHAAVIAAHTSRMKTVFDYPAEVHPLIDAFCNDLEQFCGSTLHTGNGLLHNHEVMQHDTRTPAGFAYTRSAQIIMLLDGAQLRSGDRLPSNRETLTHLVKILDGLLSEQV